MKKYSFYALCVLTTLMHTANAADHRVHPSPPRTGRSVWGQAGPAVEEEVKERDAARQAQAEPTPEQALALWLYQQRQELRNEERANPPAAHDGDDAGFLYELGQGGALQALRSEILSHLEPAPVFPGISKKLSFNTSQRNTLTNNHVAVSGDGGMVAFALPYYDPDTNTVGTTVRIHTIDGHPKLVLSDSLTLSSPGVPLSATRLAFAPHRPYLAIGTTTKAGEPKDQNTTVLFNLNDRSTKKIKHFEADHLLFSPNGSLMVIANTHRILVYNIDNLDQKPILLETTKPIELLTFSLDSSELTAKMVNEELKSWDTQNWKEVVRKKGQKQAASAFIPYFSPDFITAHASSPDGAYGAVSVSGGTILLFDRNSGRGQDHLALQEGKSTIVGLGFWPDVPYLTAVAEDGAVTLWNIGAMNKRRDAANKLLKHFLSALATPEQRVALRGLIASNDPRLITLIALLYENRLEEAHNFLTSIQNGLPKPRFKLSLKKDDFTLKDFEKSEYQTYLLQNVIMNEYAFLDT